MALKIGIIGCGSIGTLHCNSYKNMGDRVEFVACCDIVEEKAKRYAETYGFKKYYTDVHTMMAECELDAVSVTTWNAAHAECTVAALEGGANVLCEKPMAMNTAEALVMQAAAEKAGKLLMIGFVRRHGNDAATALDYIEGGYLGEIYHIDTTYMRCAGFPGNWFGDKAYSGGGPLIDLGVHMIDLSRYLAGNPKPVCVFGQTFSKLGPRDNLKSVPLPWTSSSNLPQPKFNVEDLVTAMIRFDNGMVMNVKASFSLHASRDSQTLDIYGTKGGLTLNPFVIHTEVGDRLADIQIKGNVGEGDFFTNEIRNFIDSVEGKAECKAPAKDGVELMRILDAIYQSAETGKSVDIMR